MMAMVGLLLLSSFFFFFFFFFPTSSSSTSSFASAVPGIKVLSESYESVWACFLLAWTMMLFSATASSKRLSHGEAVDSSCSRQSKWRQRVPSSSSWWCCGKAPRGHQLLLMLVSWSLVLLMLCIPSSAEEGGHSLNMIRMDTEQEFTALESRKVPCPLQTAAAIESVEQVRSAATLPNVAIYPPLLEWGSRNLFSPSTLSLTVVNLSNSTRLKLLDPVSTDEQFYSVGFSEVSIAPGERCHVHVVYLPKVMGVVGALLILQTGRGGFLVQLQGRGLASPYQLKPVGQLSAVSGSNIRRSIRLYNPYDSIIQVEEVHAWPADLDKRSLLLMNPNNSNSSESSIGMKCVPDQDGSSDGARVVLGLEVLDWEVSPGSTWEAEFELQFTSQVGKWNTYIFIRLSRAGCFEELVLPFSYEVSVMVPDLQLFPEAINFGLLTKKNEERKRGIWLRNTGKDSIAVKEMRHSLRDKNLRLVRYNKGHVLHPGRETQIATMWYKGVEESLCFDNCPKISDWQGKGGRLVVLTNSTVDSEIQLSYKAVVLHTWDGCSTETTDEDKKEEEEEEEMVRFENEDLNIRLSAFEDLERRAFSEKEFEDDIIPATHLYLSEDDNAVQQLSVQRRDKETSLLSDMKLVFSRVQIGEMKMLWVNVSNPSDKRVDMHLVLGQSSECSSAAAAAAAVDDDDDDDGHRDVFVIGKEGRTAMTVEAHEKASLGPVVFQPKYRCAYTGLLLVRNNLTLIEWLPLYGIGASAELSFFLEGDTPLESLQLSLGGLPLLSTTVTGGVEHSMWCSRQLHSTFVAKNTGDMPLQVHSLGLSNGKCRSHGFEIASSSCDDGLSLAAGESAELKISYTPDYKSSSVQPVVKLKKQDLQLVTSIGHMRVAVMVSLPDYIVQSCAAHIPIYMRHRRLLLNVAFFGLVFLLLVVPRFCSQEKLPLPLPLPLTEDYSSSSSSHSHLPTKMSNSKKCTTKATVPENNDRMVFVRDSEIPPQLTTNAENENSSSPTNLSKIRVKVALLDDDPKLSSKSSSSSATVAAAATTAAATATAAAASPKKSSTSERSGKRKKKKGAMSSLKSGTSSPSSSSTPASPLATPLSPHAPITPNINNNSSRGVKTSLFKASSNNLDDYTLLDDQATSSSSSAAAHWVPKAESSEETKSSLAGKSGKWMTVGRKTTTATTSSRAENDPKPSSSSSSSSSSKGAKLKSSSAATLTQSSTFPLGGSRSFEWRRSNSPLRTASETADDDDDGSSTTSHIIPFSARAPGTKTTTPNNTGNVNDNNTFPTRDTSNEYGESRLIYDIWSHDIWRDLSKPPPPPPSPPPSPSQSHHHHHHHHQVHTSDEQSLFSAPAFSVLPSPPPPPHHHQSPSQFSMFSYSPPTLSNNEHISPHAHTHTHTHTQDHHHHHHHHVISSFRM